MGARGRPRRRNYGDKADAEGIQDHRRQPVHARRQLLLQRRALHPAGRREMAMYRKALRCYQGAMARLHPDIERVEVPYEGLTLPAYFVKGRGDGSRPTVVLFDGMDNAKEMSVIFAGLDLAKRGFNVLAIDGPGQSEPLRLRNIPSRHDYEAAGIPAYDFVAARPDVDPKRVAVMGYSVRRLSRAAHLRVREALRRRRRVRRDALERLRFRHQPRRRRSDARVVLDFPMALGGRREGQCGRRWRSRRSSRSKGSPRRWNARSWSCTARTTASCRSTRRTSSMRRSVPRTRICASSPPRKAARNIARSITGSTASTSSATG